MSFYYSLDHECYTWKNALLWGNCVGHLKKASEGKLGDRIVHAVIALVELLPIVSQIASIAEKIFVRGMNFNPSKAHHLSNKNVVKVDDQSSSSSQENGQVENPDSKEEATGQQALAGNEGWDAAIPFNPTGQYEKAEKLLDQAFTLFDTNQYEEAEKLLDLALNQYESDPVFAKLFHLASQVKSSLGKNEEATKLRMQADAIYTSFLDNYPIDQISSEALAEAAVIKFHMNQLDKADKLFDLLLDRGEIPLSLATYVLTNAASVKYERGQYEEAYDLIQLESGRYPVDAIPELVVTIKNQIYSALSNNKEGFSSPSRKLAFN